jgi:ATP/maltotriose-dependent transcriptional regulator MalT
LEEAAKKMTSDRRVTAARDITGTVITGDIEQLHITLPQLPEIPPPEPNRPPETVGFVGRESELSLFQAQLDSAHLAVISGMAGVGKTALAANLARRSSDSENVFWHSFHEGESIEVLIWKLAGFLAWHGQEELWKMLQGARLTGGQPPPSETLFDYLLKMMRGRGYVLVLDDFQNVDQDPLLKQLVDRLRSALAASELSIIITTRRIPEFIHSGDSAPLGGLSLPDVDKLLEARDLALAPEQLEALHLLTSGNAQFLTLAIHALQYGADRELILKKMTETEDIERYLMNEVDEHLSEIERRVLEAVAVLIGYQGTAEAIEAISGLSNVRRTLRELCDRFLLIVNRGEMGREYRQHSLLQAFYYQMMGRDKRRVMHSRAGEFYERVEPDPLRAGTHYERAEEYPKAARIITENIWELVNKGEMRSVIHLLERFSEGGFDPLSRVSVNLALGELFALVGEGPAAMRSYKEAATILEGMPDSEAVRESKARAYGGVGGLLEQETPDEAMQWLQRGLTEVEGSHDLEEAALKIKIGAFQMNLGNYDQAMDYLKSGLNMLPKSALQLQAVALKNIGGIYINKGVLDDAKEYTLQALKIVRELSDFFQELDLLSNLGICKLYTSDWRGAIEDFKQAVDLAERLDSEPYQIAPRCNLGAAYIYTGGDEQAFVHLNKALELAQRCNSKIYESTIQFHLADLHIRSGDWETASYHLTEAERLALEMGADGNLPEIYSIWAEIKIAAEDYPAALEYAQTSVEKARELGEEIEQGIGLRTMGQVLFHLKENQRAIELFKESLSVLEKQEPYEAARTKAFLGQTLLKSSDPVNGKAMLVEARTTFEALGAKRDLIKLEKPL